LSGDSQARQGFFERALLILFLLSLPLVNPWVRGDGVGYYAYARAPLVEHSLDFTRDYQFANQSFREDRIGPDGVPKAAYRTCTGHLENHFTVGPAILWSPFLLAAHAGVLLARAFGSPIPADGFSAPYRYAMALGTALYGFLALLLSFRMAQKYLSIQGAFLATLAVWGGSSLAVYMYFNPSWSHAHSAFAAALFFWYWERTRENRTVQQWLIFGLITALLLNVYYANVMLVVVVLVEAIPLYAGAFRGERSPEAPGVGQLLSRHLLYGVVVIAFLLPTFISRWVVYGSPFATGYLSLRDFLWDSPVFLQVLFSANHGLFSWTPLLLVASVGLILFARRFRMPGVAFLAAAFSFYIFITFYPDWAGISSFGNRFFVSLTPLFILGLATAIDSFSKLFARPSSGQLASAALLACFVAWNLGLIYQWGTHLIPARGPISFREAAHNQVTVVPQQLTAHLRSYLFRRRDLMQQLEQKDVEQMKQNAQP
jgi:hypothetical protein